MKYTKPYVTRINKRNWEEAYSLGERVKCERHNSVFQTERFSTVVPKVGGSAHLGAMKRSGETVKGKRVGGASRVALRVIKKSKKSHNLMT